MTRLDATTANCFVFTHKEGLLSPVAHDLKLRVDRFEIEIERDEASDQGSHSIRARFETTALRVVCAMKDGREAHGSLSAKDIADIEDNIAKQVLDARRHPLIRFASTSVAPSGSGFDIHGRLAIKACERPVLLCARPRGDRLVAELSLHQPDYGIKPFSAMLGTLRIKPDVMVRIELPGSFA
jgi:polyisoprenoid-binding protein YceI